MEQTYYVLYLEKSTKQSDLIYSQDFAKKLGASGEIVLEGNFYYLTASVYLNKEDSNEILKSISNQFSGSGVLNLKRKKISNSNRLKIMDNNYIYKFFEFINILINELCEEQFNYLSGKTTQKEIISSLIKYKIELEELKNKLKINDEDELNKSVDIAQNLCLLYLDNFLNSFFESSKKSSLICSLAINITFACIDLYEGL